MPKWAKYVLLFVVIGIVECPVHFFTHEATGEIERVATEVAASIIELFEPLVPSVGLSD